MREVATASGVRPEIQALRAVAVLLVVLFHLWPGRLPGGYVGVDVFFVISGFLITAHLLREVRRTGRIDLPSFWARRARRLLPASLLVIVVSAAATLAVVPSSFWLGFFRQMAASVIYVVNWILAADSVDYLAAEDDASPVQHYWSLSVEEQFYLVWPLLILLAVVVVARRMPSRPAIVVVLGVVTVSSFAASVLLTIHEPAAAYFVTYTRAWEFGIGALLALAPTIAAPGVRVALAWIGIAAVVATGLLFTESTPFPGYAALLPTLGTAAVIWAGTTSARASFAQLSRARPVQYLGDISYSLYLWHWPPIVLLPYVTGQEVRAGQKVLILIACIALAALTKRFVEDPLRSTPLLTTRRPRVTLLVTAAAMAIAIVLPAGGWVIARADNAAATEAAESFDATAHCVGANFLLDDGCVPQDGDPLTPGIAAIRNDMAMTDCNNGTPEDGEILRCSFGPTDDSALRVAITGDSHARQLTPALLAHLDALDWHLDTYFSRGCLWGAPAPRTPECDDYREALHNRLLDGGYDVIIVTGLRGMSTTEETARSLSALRLPYWLEAVDAGAQVIVIGDNPVVPEDMVDCVIEHPTEAEAGDTCILPASRMDRPVDPYRYAAAQDSRIGYVSLDDLYCTTAGCPMVIGDVVVYRDRHHLTATYVDSLALTLVERIRAALDSL